MKCVAFDTETTGLRLHNGDKVFAWSTCDEEGNIDVTRFGHNGSASKFESLIQQWETGTIRPVSHYAKFDLTGAEKIAGRHLANRIKFHCTHLEANIVRNTGSHELKELAYIHAGIQRDDEQEVKRLAAQSGGDYSLVPEDKMKRYQALDAYRCMLLHLFYYPMIQKNPKWLSVYESELQTAVVTMRMEERGVMIRRSAAQKLIDDLDRQREEVLEQAEAIVGKPVSLSGDELLWLLFQHYNLPVLERTTGGKPSTEKESMLALRTSHGVQFPIIDLVLKFRSWQHGAAILRSYLEFADSDGVIHSSINPCGAVTCRQSSEKPNLHNVSKSRALLNPYPVPARRIFMPRPGYVNVHVDFSGEEMRLLLHYCNVYCGKDKLLWDMVVNGGDLHYPATKILYPDYDGMLKSLQKSVRDACKNTNFAGAYQATDMKMCVTAGLPPDIGLPRIRQWRDAFPNLSRLSKELGRLANRQGYVDTCFGRRLWLRKLHAPVNTLVQGTGAEVLKRAENAAEGYLQEATGGEVELILSIHDEMIFQVPRQRLSDFRGIMPELARRMTDFPEISVPMLVDAKIATFNWEQTTPFTWD